MLDLLAIPKECIYNQFVPKKQFYEHGNLTSREKKLFVDGIEKITLYAQLTRNNTNIDPFKSNEKTYEEVSVFIVKFKKYDQLDTIATLIMKTIPYPMILISKIENKYSFYGAHQRNNLQDTSKIILQELYKTGFLEDDNFFKKISYDVLNKQSFYTLYDHYIQEIISYNLLKRNIAETEKSDLLLRKIEQIEEEINMLKNKLSRESHFNKKMDININIKKLEQQLKQMEA